MKKIYISKNTLNGILLGITIVMAVIILLLLFVPNQNPSQNNYTQDQTLEMDQDRYNNTEIKQLVLTTLQDDYKLESPKIVRAQEEYTEGDITGKVHIYKFDILTDDMKYLAEYISIGKELITEEFDKNQLKLYDMFDEEVKINDEEEIPEFTCNWDKTHIDISDLTDIQAQEYKINKTSGIIETYNNSEIKSITINGVTFDYTDLLASMGNIDIAKEVASHFSYINDEEYNETDFINYYTGISKKGKHKGKSNIKLSLKVDKSILDEASIIYTFGDIPGITLFEKSSSAAANLYETDNYTDYYITCMDGTIIHIVNADKNSDTITYAQLKIANCNYKKERFIHQDTKMEPY